MKEASQEGNSGRKVLANLSTVVVTNHSTIRAGLVGIVLGKKTTVVDWRDEWDEAPPPAPEERQPP